MEKRQKLESRFQSQRVSRVPLARAAGQSRPFVRIRSRTDARISKSSHPSCRSGRAVTLIVSDLNVKFELAGHRCVFGIDARGRIDPRVISDALYTPSREPVQLMVTLSSAPAKATFKEMCEMGCHWGIRFVPVTR